MKVEKANLKKAIEKIIGDGVINGEEVDITATKVVNKVYPLIQYSEDFKESIKQIVNG